MNEPVLTPRLAYLAMYEFLDRHYRAGAITELGGLLGSMSLLADGKPADGAAWGEWQEAVKAVLAAESAPDGYRGADLRLG